MLNLGHFVIAGLVMRICSWLILLLFSYLNVLSRGQRAEEFSLNAVPTLGSVTIVMGVRGAGGVKSNFAI